MIRSPDPELDLTMTRIIRAPRASVWRAWTDRTRFEKWWVPAPAKCRVVDMDLKAGGGLVTHISEDGGAFVPHLNACFLAVDDLSRIVFTDTLVAGWRPAENAFMTAVITLSDHPQGTHYAAHVMHRSKADRDMHEEMGFHDGWGTVAEQLAHLVEETR